MCILLELLSRQSQLHRSRVWMVFLSPNQRYEDAIGCRFREDPISLLLLHSMINEDNAP